MKRKSLKLRVQAAATPDPRAPVIATDYEDVGKLEDILSSHGVQVVISSLRVIDEKAGELERNLVKAAAKSASTKRFIASNWGFPNPPKE
jgi:hypothetical protein